MAQDFFILIFLASALVCAPLSDFDQIIEVFIAKFIATILTDAVVIALSHLIFAINSDSDRCIITPALL